MPPQREEAGLSGAVRSVRTDVIQFARQGGKLVEKPWYHATVDYDADGRATLQVSHNPKGGVTRSMYQYDPAGRLAEMRMELDGVGAGRTVYLYDDAGRLTYELSLRADGSEGRQTRRIYDTGGGYTEEFTVDTEPGGLVLAPVENAEGATDGERARFIRTRRDAGGRPLEIRFYDSTGGLLHRFVYHYNAAGRLTDMEQCTGDTGDMALSTVRYRYDQQGRRTEAATWAGADCIDRRTFAYNDRGDCAAEKHYGQDGRLQSEKLFDREYDSQGNWVRETVRMRDGQEDTLQPFSLARRAITYNSS